MQYLPNTNLNMKDEGWIEKISSPSEKQMAKADLGLVEKGIRMLQYVRTMENLKSLNRVSLAGYQADMEDISASRSEDDLNRIGKTWKTQISVADERTKELSELLNLIGQKIPSDAKIDLEDRLKTLRQQGNIH